MTILIESNEVLCFFAYLTLYKPIFIRGSFFLNKKKINLSRLIFEYNSSYYLFTRKQAQNDNIFKSEERIYNYDEIKTKQTKEN